MPNKGTTGTIIITSLVWRGLWLGIEPGTSRSRSQHSTTRLSRRRKSQWDDFKTVRGLKGLIWPFVDSIILPPPHSFIRWGYKYLPKVYIQPVSYFDSHDIFKSLSASLNSWSLVLVSPLSVFSLPFLLFFFGHSVITYLNGTPLWNSKYKLTIDHWLQQEF